MNYFEQLPFHSSKYCTQFADPPGPPGVPHGVETTEDSITISWTKPRHDGGSPILGYVIEKKLIGEDKWTKATHAHIAELTYK